MYRGGGFSAIRQGASSTAEQFAVVAGLTAVQRLGSTTAWVELSTHCTVRVCTLVEQLRQWVGGNVRHHTSAMVCEAYNSPARVTDTTPRKSIGIG